MTVLMRATQVFIITALTTSAMELSGRVTFPNGTPCPGVTVVLVSGSMTALTDAAGYWALSSSVSVGKRAQRQMLARNLALENGKLSLSWGSRDVAGRKSEDHVAELASSKIAARATATGVDTIVYSMGGKVFLRDTISASRTGIVRTYDVTWNTNIIYGWLTDSRDGLLYRTVTIGSQTWLAENLQYRGNTGDEDTVGVCFMNNRDSCLKYGRIYTWSEAMDTTSRFDSVLLSASQPHQGICPEGWHIPSEKEWINLTDTVLEPRRAGIILQSTWGWQDNFRAKDSLGFRILGAGYTYEGRFITGGRYAHLWTSTEDTPTKALGHYLSGGDDWMGTIYGKKIDRFSLRCRKN